MDFNDDIHLDVCRDIEVGLKAQYELHPELTDDLCIFGLDSAVIAVKQHFGFAKNQRIPSHPLIGGIIDYCVELGARRIDKVNDLTLKEYILRIEKIKRPVKRHSDFGVRGYYDFIKKYV